MTGLASFSSRSKAENAELTNSIERRVNLRNECYSNCPEMTRQMLMRDHHTA